MTEYPLAYAPSYLHHALAREIQPRLAYDGGDVAAWQGRLRSEVHRLVGYDRMPTDPPPLNVRPLWKTDHELGTIEKLAFTAEEGADAPAYLCLPKEGEPPYPVFVCLQGHSSGMHNSIAVSFEDESQPIEVEGDRDFALHCMRRGVAALCIEQRCFGERRERLQSKRAEHRCQDGTMQALQLGRTMIGERVFDVQRGIELLAHRGDLDMDRVGVMGNSGGGTITMFAAALLDRVRWAMPSCYFCTFRDSIMSMKHCVDNYVPGLMEEAEMADIMGLFAPNPVVVVAGREDPIFPLSGVEEGFERLRTIYAAAGAEDQCQLVIGEGGHRFYAEPAWAAMAPLMQRGAVAGTPSR